MKARYPRKCIHTGQLCSTRFTVLMQVVACSTSDFFTSIRLASLTSFICHSHNHIIIIVIMFCLGKGLIRDRVELLNPLLVLHRNGLGVLFEWSAQIHQHNLLVTAVWHCRPCYHVLNVVAIYKPHVKTLPVPPPPPPPPPRDVLQH